MMWNCRTSKTIKIFKLSREKEQLKWNSKGTVLHLSNFVWLNSSWILISSHSISLNNPCHVASGRLHWESESEKAKFPELLWKQFWAHRHIPWWGFPGGSVVKNMPANAGKVGLIPDLGRSPGEGNPHSSILAWEIPWTEEPCRL